MAIISGVTVNWQLSPRVITIPSSETEVTIRDLQDTLLDLEDDVEGILWTTLRETSGGEDLGGGTSVGWTMELQNAVIAPAPRTVQKSEGAVTTANSDGTKLIDIGATFISDGVEAGATIINFTDGSVTSVISVDSETQLTHYTLDSGTDNDWDMSDSYTVWNEVQFNITGGNLVAVDEFDVVSSPIRSTFGNEILKTSSSSATTQELSAIQFASFGGGVSIDIVNGVSGTDYPIGTQESPVDNLADAVTIANIRGLRKLYIIENMTLGGVVDITGFIIEGRSHTSTSVVISTDLITQDTTYRAVNITSGVLDGDAEIDNCMVGNLTYFNGHVHDSGLYGMVTLSGNADATFSHCITVDQDNPPSIDMGGMGNSLAMPNYSGLLTVSNSSDVTSEIGIGLDAGSVVLDSTITAGTVIISGVGTLTNNTTGTATVDTDGLLNKALVSSAVWNETLETGVSTSDAIRVLLATLAGEASGGGTTSIEFKNPAGDATRVTMTVDTDGNRSAISLSP